MNASPGKSARVPPDMDGARLDRAMDLVCPGVGLSARRRLIARGLVLAAGRPGTPGQKMRSGDEIILLDAPDQACPAGPAGGVRVVSAAGGFVALAKPAGLHTAALAHTPGPSLEACLPALLPGQDPRLLTRLDRPTSGLVLAALAPEAAHRFRDIEARGLAVKRYLAVVAGELDRPLVLDRALDTAKRTKTRVLPGPDPDPARHTRVEPLASAALAALVPGADRAGRVTLVRATIGRGARHQIRAHLAQAGHPLLGDPLYGPAPDAPFRLHHGRVDFPGFSARLAPDWPLAPFLAGDWADLL